MKITRMDELGPVLRAERKRKGATQKQLSLVSGTGLRFIIELEHSKATCQIGKVLRVLRALGGSIELPGRGTGPEVQRP